MKTYEVGYDLALNFESKFVGHTKSYTDQGIPLLLDIGRVTIRYTEWQLDRSNTVTAQGFQDRYEAELSEKGVRESISTRDTGMDVLRRDFADFREILDEIEGSHPPVPLDTPIAYDLKVTRHKVPFDSRRSLRNLFAFSKLKAGAVPYWQLPSRLFDLQDRLGLGREGIPAYRICFEHHGSIDNSYRITHEADTLDDLLAGLEEKVPEEHRQRRDDVWAMQSAPLDDDFWKGKYRGVNGLPHFQISLHNFGDPEPFLIETGTMQDYDMLVEDVRRQASRRQQFAPVKQEERQYFGFHIG